MRKILYLILLLFSVSLQAYDSQIASSLCSKKQLLNSVINTEEKIDLGITDVNHGLNCGIAEFGIVQKIVYNKISDSLDISFSSACMRCGLCVVIANKINKTLIDKHAAISSSDRRLGNPEIDEIFEMICNQSFTRYRLREVNGERYIGESLPGSLLIESTANGLWGLKLKEKCKELIQEIGTENLYKHWLEWYYESQQRNLTQILCYNNIGILRDCRSLGSGHDSLQNQAPFQFKINSQVYNNCLP